jgi:hypothetical protein
MSNPPTLASGALATLWENPYYQGNSKTWTVNDVQNGQIISTGCSPYLNPQSLSLAPGTVIQFFANVNCSAPSNIAGWKAPALTFVAGNSQLNVPDINATYQYDHHSYAYVITPPPSYQLTGKAVGVQVTYPNPGSSSPYSYNGSCLGLDWTSNTGCISADYNVCPKFGGSGPLLGFGFANNYNDPNNYRNASTNSVTLNCTYDLAQFQTNQDIESFYNGNWVNPSTAKSLYNNTIMPSICPRQTLDCPNDITGKKMPGCSTFVMQSQNSLGTACQNWISRSRDSSQGIGTSQVDTTMKTYCNLNSTSDCRCLQPNNVTPTDPGYQAGLNAFASYIPPDNCWYIPCEPQSEGRYLITSDIADTVCPSTVCISNVGIGTIQNYGNSISLGGISTNQQCIGAPPPPPGQPPGPTSTGNQPPITPAGNPPTGTPPRQPPAGTPPAASSRSNYLIYIIIGIVVILLIAGAIGFFFILK